MMNTRLIPALSLCFFITIFQTFTPILAGDCGGSPWSCSSFASCASQAGCYPDAWWGGCSGSATSCSSFSGSSFSCESQMGCVWSEGGDDPSDNSSENSGISAGAIAGIVVGVLVATGIFIYIYIKKPWKRCMDGSSSAVASVHDEPGIKDMEKADSSPASEASMKDTEDQHDSPTIPKDSIGMELSSYPQGNKKVRSHTTKTSSDGSRTEVIEYTDGSKVTKTFTVSS